MKPKEFIYNLDQELSEAIDNGYDLRMSEPDILYWMEKYSNFKIKQKINSIKKDQVLNKYLNWVDQVSEDLEDKTTFEPKEIVSKICEIIENDLSESKEWINVNDELPPKNISCWGYNPSKNKITIIFPADPKGAIEQFKITHWAYIVKPEPPNN